MTGRRVVFLEQGRTHPRAALGHVRVRHALATGDIDDLLDPLYAEVPPFRRWHHRLIRPFRRLGPWHLRTVRWHLVRGWMARRLILRLIDQESPDVVHITTDQVGLLLSPRIQRRVPCVLSLDVLTLDWVRLKAGLPAGDAAVPGYLRPVHWLERRALRQAPLCVAWTDGVAARIRRLAPDARVEVLHPGIDLQAFRPRGARGDLTGAQLRVLFVGGRWLAKGGPDLLAALQPRLGRDVHLDVVTTERVDLPDGAALHELAPGSDDLVELFAAADVFCLPTSVDAVPWAVLEAMACGVPTVSCDVGSIAEMLGTGTERPAGTTVAPSRPTELRAALDRLLDDENLRVTWGRNARARAEAHYDAVTNTARLASLLQDVAVRAGDRQRGGRRG